jgi:hypothetical protein
MTLTISEILIFCAILGFLLYGVVRNALWSEAKDMEFFAKRSRPEKWQYSLRRNLTLLAVGLLLLCVWRDIELGWVWLILGVVLMVFGLAAIAGFFLKKHILEAGFELEPPTDAKLKANVGKMKSSSLLFLCLLGLWIYSWIHKVI